ncbi:YybH family protein [Sphingomonas cavernae]|nr:nuclear transport factor 2 family protein [Sphingomonas cavernae]
MKLLIAAALLAAPCVAQASDTEANAVYERMIAAYAKLDPALIESVYAPGATYLPQGSTARIDTRETIIRGVLGFQEQLRASGGSLSMKMRIVDRKRFDGVYVDNGYVRTTVIPASGAAPRVTTSKFATVVARQANGRWAIVTDAASATPAEAFDQAVAISGAKFDE